MLKTNYLKTIISIKILLFLILPQIVLFSIHTILIFFFFFTFFTELRSKIQKHYFKHKNINIHWIFNIFISTVSFCLYWKLIETLNIPSNMFYNTLLILTLKKTSCKIVIIIINSYLNFSIYRFLKNTWGDTFCCTTNPHNLKKYLTPFIKLLTTTIFFLWI